MKSMLHLYQTASFLVGLCSAQGMLQLLVKDFEEALSAKIEERSQHHEYMDATEALVDISMDMGDKISDWILSNGPSTPPHALKKFQEAHRAFWGAGAKAQPHSHYSPDQEALQGKKAFEEAVEIFERYYDQTMAKMKKAV